MDNRMDNLSLVPKWISKMEQDVILQGRSTETHFWDNNNHRMLRRGRAGAARGGDHQQQQLMEEDQMLSDQELEGGQAGGQHLPPRLEDKGERRKGENSLYWKAITQLLANETEEVNGGKIFFFWRVEVTLELKLCCF